MREQNSAQPNNHWHMRHTVKLTRLHSQSVLAAAFFIVFFYFFPSTAKAVVVGREGLTYSIVEKDMRELIQEKARNFDAEAWKLKEQQRISDKISKFRPVDAVEGLPPSQTGEGYQVDLTYTLPYDIHDVNGNIIYPKGFTFNPLELMQKKGLGLSKVLVVINGTRENEIKWFTSKFEDYRAPHIMLLLTDGYAIELGNALKRQVMYLPESLKQRLNIRETPSVVVQMPRAKYLTVKPYVLDSNGNEIRVKPANKKKR